MCFSLLLRILLQMHNLIHAKTTFWSKELTSSSTKFQDLTYKPVFYFMKNNQFPDNMKLLLMAYSPHLGKNPTKTICQEGLFKDVIFVKKC